MVAAMPHDDAAIEAVHDPGLLAFLASAWADWEAAGPPDDPGQDRVVPYIFPHPGLMGGLEPQVPAATWARPGAFCFDTMTLIGPGTWEAARAAADAALTAADLVADGAPLAYACCRPPGHHVTPQRLRRLLLPQQRGDRGAATCGRAARRGSAIVDIDAHHGNGAQSIFWERNDVFTASVHVDPATGWFPHFLGGATERGAGAGVGANLNVPLPPGAGTTSGCAAVAELVQAARSRAAPRRSCWRSASTRRAATRRARSTLRRGVFARPAALSANTGCRSSSYRKAGTISPRSAGSCSRPCEGLEEGHGNA